jgi:hypothetical protein
MTPWERRAWLHSAACVLAFEALVGLLFLADRLWADPPPVAPVQPEVVRVLDVVIRDSNTSNRRQRFECRPARE